MRAEITVKGEVQGVGFRDAVLKIARRLDVRGFVENLKPYDVKIVCEGEDEKIGQFIELIKIKKFPIFVENVEIEYKVPTGEFECFEIKRGNWKDEMGERMDIAGMYLYRTVELGEESVACGKESVSIGKKMLEKQDMMLEKQDMMLEKQDMMLEKQDMMLEKQDMMLGKQDQTIDVLKGIEGKQDKMLGKQDMMLEKQDMMLGKQDQTIGVLKGIEGKQDMVLGKQVQTIDTLKEIKGDTGDMKNSMKSIPVILEEISYLKMHQKNVEAEIIKIKEILKIS